MKHSRVLLTQSPRSQVWPGAAEAAVEAEVSAVVEAEAETEVAVRSPEPPSSRTLLVTKTNLGVNPATGAPGTLMGPLHLGAPCTGSGAGRLSSARSRGRVHGRTSLLPSLINETGTSSARLIIKQNK